MLRSFGVRVLPFHFSALLLALLLPARAVAESSCTMLVPQAPLTEFGTSSAKHPKIANCACYPDCTVGNRCYKPEFGGVEFQVSGVCDPTVTTCTIQARVPMVFPGNSQSLNPFGGGGPKIEVREGTTLVSTCAGGVGNEIAVDEGVLLLSQSFTCLAPVTERTFEVKAIACVNSPTCTRPTETTLVHFSDALLHEQLCEPQIDYPCSTQACNACIGGGGGPGRGAKGGSGGGAGPSAPVGGGGASTTPPGQPGAVLSYFAGGVGALGMPGATVWRATLGRFWAHEFAERIVVDPDESHVWLLTREAAFVEFEDLASGTGLQPYGTARPSDEYRTLYFDNDTGGWQLVDLDGDVFFYDDQGRWYRSEDRNGNAWVGSFDGSGRIAQVTLPDGQSESFAYDTVGRLASLTRIGVGGSPTRIWSYEWSGPDLVRIRYPDGRARRFEYHSEIGYMTHQILEGQSSTIRYEQAWSYDDEGNVIAAWKGALNFTDAAAVEKWQLAYDDADLPTETTVTDPLGGLSTYEVGRDLATRKPRILSISGACPVCGSAPNTSYVFDSAHPLRVTMETSPGGVRTDFTYDAHGQVTSRIDAATTVGHPHLPRVTEWEYDADFPALVTRIEGPTAVGDSPTRITLRSYDAAVGDLLSRTISGVESTSSGGGFSLATSYAGYNAAGQVGTIDPPGYGANDQTTWTYAVAGRNGLLADTRTDPLVGTTSFGYDAFNRRTTVTDPNGVTTTTAYDALDRVTSVTQGGDPGTTADDRVTGYAYNRLGDFYCVKSPTGAGTEYLYDAAGRLTEIRRGLAVTTPSDTSCLSISSTNFAERQLFTLDAAGHRILQKLDRGTSTTAWTNQSETSWVYGSMCHLDQMIEKIDATTSAVTEYAYDCQGNLEQVWDSLHPRTSYPSQPSTTYGYDPLDRMTSMTQPWGGYGGGTVTTSYEYDVQDHLVAVTDGEGTVTSYEYSDRDLLTGQDSEVSGATTYAYNEHGELVSETDARPVTVVRTVDAADRVTLVDYPTSSLDTTYTWGTSATGWQKGRLLSIAKGGSSVDYTYDPFGELLQDGALTHTYDKDGNQLTITYPGDLLATYTYDRMGRQTSLQLKEGANPAVYLVRNNPLATYKAFGPLASLRFDLTTDRNETRTYDFRYRPQTIAVDGALLSWTYSNDTAGNVTAIDDTLATNQDRWFQYQDWQYFLTSTTGPVGTGGGGTSWYTYDRAGNRIADANTPVTRWYSYSANAAGTGNTSRLLSTCVEFAMWCFTEHVYTWDAAGNLDYFEADANVIDLAPDDSNRLSRIDRLSSSGLGLTYDGRGFLMRAEVQRPEPPYPSSGVLSEPLYDSAGRLMSIDRVPWSHAELELTNVLYFAGRPIGLWKKVGTGVATTTSLVTDHLGTPILALTGAGATHWYGGFEPFGHDWQQGSANDALAKGIILRLPGQWDDANWEDPTLGLNLYYNVHRWYEPQTGRYTRPDPLGHRGERNPYVFARSRPTRFVDFLGLLAGDSCGGIRIKRKHINFSAGPEGDKYGHWWAEINGSESYGWWPKNPVGPGDTVCGVEGELNGQTSFGGTGTSDPHQGDTAEDEFTPVIGGDEGCACQDCSGAVQCIRNFALSYGGSWSWPVGQNCHSFQQQMMKQCCLQKPGTLDWAQDLGAAAH